MMSPGSSRPPTPGEKIAIGRAIRAERENARLRKELKELCTDALQKQVQKQHIAIAELNLRLKIANEALAAGSSLPGQIESQELALQEEREAVVRLTEEVKRLKADNASLETENISLRTRLESFGESEAPLILEEPEESFDRIGTAGHTGPPGSEVHTERLPHQPAAHNPLVAEVLVSEKESDQKFSSVVPYTDTTPSGSRSTSPVPEKAKNLLRSVTKSLEKTVDWRRNRDKLDSKIQSQSRLAAFFGIMGSFASITGNELMFRGMEPSNQIIDMLKLTNTILTGVCLLFLFRMYRLKEIFERLTLHIRFGTDLSLNVYAIELLQNPWFLMETVICGIHLPPFVSFRFGSRSMGNYALYQAETVDAAYSMIRWYLLWRVVEHLSMKDLPHRHSLAMHGQFHLNATFAFKRLMDSWVAPVTVSIFWAVGLLLLGYWVRLGEITACHFDFVEPTEGDCQSKEAKEWTINGVDLFEKFNDYYIQNSCWLMFITSTSVGFGDTYPSTHLGRFMSSIATILGIILISLLTASLGNALKFTADENSALLLLTREKYRDALVGEAAKLLKIWYDLKKRKPRGRLRDRYLLKLQQAKSRFKFVRSQSTMDIEDCSDDGYKLVQVQFRIQTMEESLEILENFHNGQVPDAPVRDSKMRRLERSESMIALKQSINRRSSMGPNKVKNSLYKHALEVALRKVFEENWQHKRDEIFKRRNQTSMWAAFFGITGAAFGVVANELVWNNVEVGSIWVNICKGINSLMTVCCIIFICRYHWLTLLFNRAVAHLRSNQDLHRPISMIQVAARLGFWREVVLVAIHLPPFMSFELGAFQMDNFVAYRAETLFAVFNTLRTYLLCRVVKIWMLSDLPRIHTVAAHTGVKFGYAFAIKRSLTGLKATQTLAVVWTATIFFLGYWLMCAEHSACRLETTKHSGCLTLPAREWQLYGSAVNQANMDYHQNALWVIFISSTTVGYGDMYPVTHAGRCVVVVAALTGLVFASLLTAALTNAIAWTPVEEEALRLLQRRKLQLVLQDRAARVLQAWWRTKKLRSLSQTLKFRELVHAFSSSCSQMRKSKEIEEISGSQQVSRMFSKARHVSERLYEYTVRVMGPDAGKR